jgi:hypothetical protein
LLKLAKPHVREKGATLVLEEKNILTPNILLPLHEKCNPNF